MAGLISEDVSILGLTYLLVYKSDKYKKLKSEIERQSKKCKFCGFLILEPDLHNLSFVF